MLIEDHEPKEISTIKIVETFQKSDYNKKEQIFQELIIMLKAMTMTVVLFMVGGGSLLYSFWLSSDNLAPKNSQNNENNYLLIKSAQSKVFNKIENQLAKKKQSIELSPEDINQLFITKIAQNYKYRNILLSTGNFTTKIENKRLEITALVNPGKIPLQSYSPTQQLLLKQIFKILQTLEPNQQLRVKIVGQPVIQNSRLTWTADSQIQFSHLNLTLSQLAKKLELTPEQLQTRLGIEIDNLNFQDVELVDEQVILRLNLNKKAITK